MSHWWIERGYPAFEEGKDGFPRTGQVIAHYRRQKRDEVGKIWTQNHLARALGIKKHAAINIERHDADLNTERRRFLCRILDIPTDLLGVKTLDEILSVDEKGLLSSPIGIIGRDNKGIDTEEHYSYLTTCRKYHATTGHDSSMTETSYRMGVIYQEMFHTRNSEPLQKLLCEYHRFVAALLRDRMEYGASLEHMDRALCFADSLKNIEMQAMCHLNIGHTLSDANDAERAVKEFDWIRMHEKKLPTYFYGSFLLYSGPAYAKAAKTGRERRDALMALDRGGNLARTMPTEAGVGYIFDLSPQRYHLNKGSALINLGRNDEALDELRLVRGGRIWWTSFNDILTAQAFTNLKKYEVAIVSAEEGLKAVQTIDSRVNIARVQVIYNQLAASPYKNNPDVARLGLLLRS